MLRLEVTLKPKSTWLLLFCLALCGAPAALADTIPFFNTGLAANGTLLAAGAADPHYAFLLNPDNAAYTVTATAANGAWAANTSNAGWVSPGASGAQSWSAGYYVSPPPINLTGYNPLSVVFSGLVAADNGISIYLNRTGSALFSMDGFSTLSAFNINSGFVSGINQIDFVVRNDGGPTGLMVANGQVTANAQTPEPAALLLVGTGLVVGLVAVRMRSGESGPAKRVGAA